MSILIMISIILEQYILKDGLLFTVRELKWPINITPTEGRVRVIEFWGHNHTDSEKKQIWFYDKTIDLKNLTLKIVVVDHPPGVVKYTDSNGMVEYAGTEIEIVKSLSKIMKFSYEFYDADPVTKWGGRNVSSSNSREFYGAIAQLIYGEADMAIGSFFILKHYLSYIDMSIPLEVACTSFLTPNPLPRPRYLALLLPFRFELWILLMILSILIGPFFLYIYTRPNYYKTEHGVFKNQILLTSCRIMTQVALHFWPKFWPIRIYIAFYWFFWFCITSGYRAAMVSFLTIPLYGRVIDNTKELVESNFGIGGCGEELQRIFLQHLEVNPDLYIRTTLSQRYEVLTDLNEGIGRVAAGNFALYENTRFLKYTRMTRNLSKSGYPQMRLMKQCIVPVQIGFAYQKLSPITWTINRYIRSFQESGLTNRWAQGLIVLTKERNRENPDNNENSISDGGIDDSIPDTNKSRKQRVLRIQDLQGAVYLLVLGLTLSFLTFIGEFFFQKCRQTSKDVILKKLINTSIISTYVIGDFKKEKLVDVRVRKKKKVKVPKKLPLYPYLE